MTKPNCHVFIVSSWFISRPGKLETAVPVPALRGDDLHTMTVLPYLIAYHYGSDESPQFVTARELNGEYYSFLLI